MFQLSQLLSLDSIVIQCHNAPDPDTIACALAIHTYLKSHGKPSRIVYSGFDKITKPNILEMLEKLNIPPLEYVKKDDIPHIETLVLVDCQPGQSNVTEFSADTVVVIDHHIKEKDVKFDYGIIHEYLGSCSTLVWQLLTAEDFDLSQYPDVSTALYYGLFTDTGKLEEIWHPVDKDALDNLDYNVDIARSLRDNNIALEELKIAGSALADPVVNSVIKYAIFCADECDPNILGFIGDLATEASGVDLCVTYTKKAAGYKLSVRSCSKTVKASEFVKFICMGNGGGHIRKAAGFISMAALPSDDIKGYLQSRIKEYFDGCDEIVAANHDLDTDSPEFGTYQKKSVPLGYAMTLDLFDSGTPLVIRTLEGDTERTADGDTYLMLGILGEVYHIDRAKWEQKYTPTAEMFVTDTDFLEKNHGEYTPKVINKLTGEAIDFAQLRNNAQTCVTTGETQVYAKQLEKRTKVFAKYHFNDYFDGAPGDYLVVLPEDKTDVYIVRKDIFERTYTFKNS